MALYAHNQSPSPARRGPHILQGVPDETSNRTAAPNSITATMTHHKRSAESKLSFGVNLRFIHHHRQTLKYDQNASFPVVQELSKLYRKERRNKKHALLNGRVFQNYKAMVIAIAGNSKSTNSGYSPRGWQWKPGKKAHCHPDHKP